MYYAIKDALEKATDSNRNIDEYMFIDELSKGYQSSKSLGFIRELLKCTFTWTKAFSTIESDLEKFKERVAAEMYFVLFNML